MGKKSKRRSPSRSAGTDDQRRKNGAFHRNAAANSTAAFKEALAECSLDRLRTIYTEMLVPVFKELGMPKTNLVSDDDIHNDSAAARKMMEKQMGRMVVVEQLPKSYRMKLVQEIQSMGVGIKITFVAGKKAGSSYAYTCGFGSVGGKELLVQDVHRSMYESSVCKTFNFLFARHMGGHPLANGHAVDCGGLAYMVGAPDRVEACLLKGTKTLEPTRLYGLAGYDILLLLPVAVKTENDDTGKGTSHMDIVSLALGCEIHGFKTLQGDAKKLEACAWCRQTRDTAAQTPLMKCMGCKKTYYCSREHQKLDWKNHKQVCQRSKEDREKDEFFRYMEPFIGKNGTKEDLKNLVEPFIRKNAM